MVASMDGVVSDVDKTKIKITLKEMSPELSRNEVSVISEIVQEVGPNLDLEVMKNISAAVPEMRVLADPKVIEAVAVKAKDVKAAEPSLATNSIFFCFLFCEKSLICLEGKSMSPHRGNTILFRSSQQLPCLRLGPLTHLVRCFRNYGKTRTPSFVPS